MYEIGFEVEFNVGVTTKELLSAVKTLVDDNLYSELEREFSEFVYYRVEQVLKIARELDPNNPHLEEVEEKPRRFADDTVKAVTEELREVRKLVINNARSLL